jgi:hypothetical protein
MIRSKAPRRPSRLGGLIALMRPPRRLILACWSSLVAAASGTPRSETHRHAPVVMPRATVRSPSIAPFRAEERVSEPLPALSSRDTVSPASDGLPDVKKAFTSLAVGDEYVERQRAASWARYDEALQNYLDWVRLGADFACDVWFDPPQRPTGPRPKA